MGYTTEYALNPCKKLWRQLLSAGMLTLRAWEPHITFYT